MRFITGLYSPLRNDAKPSMSLCLIRRLKTTTTKTTAAAAAAAASAATAQEFYLTLARFQLAESR